MRWLFERVVDRLIAKLTLLLAARFESHTEMELVETKAEMLRRADELERDDSPEGKTLAAELRAAAARLGRGEHGPAGDVLAAVEQLHGEELRRPDALRIGSQPKSPARPALDGPVKKSGKANSRKRS